MEKEITTKFSSCLAYAPDNFAVVKIFDSEEKNLLATVKLRPLSYGELSANPTERMSELLYLAITEWDLKDDKGLIPITKDTVANLTAQVGYGLLAAFQQLNLVSETEEKNLERQ